MPPGWLVDGILTADAAVTVQTLLAPTPRVTSLRFDARLPLAQRQLASPALALARRAVRQGALHEIARAAQSLRDLSCASRWS
jgi:hypothetical protein